MLFERSHASDRLFSSYKDIYAMSAHDMGNPTEHPFDTFKYSVSYDEKLCGGKKKKKKKSCFYLYQLCQWTQTHPVSKRKSYLMVKLIM